MNKVTISVTISIFFLFFYPEILYAIQSFGFVFCYHFFCYHFFVTIF